MSHLPQHSHFSFRKIIPVALKVDTTFKVVEDSNLKEVRGGEGELGSQGKVWWGCQHRALGIWGALGLGHSGAELYITTDREPLQEDSQLLQLLTHLQNLLISRNFILV